MIVNPPDVEVAARNLSLAIEREIGGYPDLNGLFMACDAYLFVCRASSVCAEQVDSLRSLAQTLTNMSDEEFQQTNGHRRMVIAFFKAFGDAAGTLAVRTAMECGLDFIPRALGEPEERLRGEFWQLTLQSVEALIAGDVAQLFAIRVMQLPVLRIKFEVERDGPRASRKQSSPGTYTRIEGGGCVERNPPRYTVARLGRGGKVGRFP